MRNMHWIVACAALIAVTGVRAQDWPQWRGTNRDAKVTGFTAPRAGPRS